MSEKKTEYPTADEIAWGILSNIFKISLTFCAFIVLLEILYLCGREFYF